MRTKQQGNVLIGSITVLLGFLYISGILFVMFNNTMSVQEVKEQEQRCTQAGGEAVISLNSNQSPLFVQCKLGAVLYSKF